MKDPTSIIKKLQLTEKGTVLAEQQGKYLFQVVPDANKIEIRHAVEQLFGVKVAAVNTMQYEGKQRRTRSARRGKKADWKRAVVTLRAGGKIDLA